MRELQKNTETFSQQLLAAIDAQLREIAQQLAANFDIAPTRHWRLEALSAAALMANVDSPSLLQFFRERLPPQCRVQLDEAGAIALDIWQTRAPVFPSTTD